jgi:hypothetical protein
VETSGNVGDYLDIAVAADKKVYIVYRDNTKNRIRAAVITLVNKVDQNCDGF